MDFKETMYNLADAERKISESVYYEEIGKIKEDIIKNIRDIKFNYVSDLDLYIANYKGASLSIGKNFIGDCVEVCLRNGTVFTIYKDQFQNDEGDIFSFSSLKNKTLIDENERDRRIILNSDFYKTYLNSDCENAIKNNQNLHFSDYLLATDGGAVQFLLYYIANLILNEDIKIDDFSISKISRSSFEKIETPPELVGKKYKNIYKKVNKEKKVFSCLDLVIMFDDTFVKVYINGTSLNTKNFRTWSDNILKIIEGKIKLHNLKS